MSDSPVFPDVMRARCRNGHEWQAEVVWEVIHVHGDPLMRTVNRCWPPQCPRCLFPPSGYRLVEPWEFE